MTAAAPAIDPVSSGLLSFVKTTSTVSGCFSTSAHSEHGRSFRVSGCFGSQGQGICARKAAEKIASANTTAFIPNTLPAQHYTEDLSRSWLIFPLLVLYLLDLGGVGLLLPDEPRYASVGREMARSHDFVTPRLDGKPWFEKPPLLFWMIAAGRFLHLPDEWAARLPVALLSVAFLIFFFNLILHEFSFRTAIAATTILATSAGWLAYSFVAVTDLPMAATFAAAMLIAIFDTRRRQGYVSGALLGLAILGKGFVPVVLFLPMFLVERGKRLDHPRRLHRRSGAMASALLDAKRLGFLAGLRLEAAAPALLFVLLAARATVLVLPAGDSWRLVSVEPARRAAAAAKDVTTTYESASWWLG